MKRSALWLAVPALLPAAGLEAAADMCLRMVAKPPRKAPETIRSTEIVNGFGDCVEAYEKRWAREPFELARHGAILRGEIIDNPADRSTRRKIAVICHGHTVSRLCSLKYTDIFYRAGFTVLIYDERSFGQSTGGFCTLGQEESKDLAAVLAFARQRFGKNCLLAVHGESMGAATALLALRYDRPDLVIADCPFADSELLFRHWVKRNLHLPPALVLPFFERNAKNRYSYLVRETSPIAALRRADVPVCLIHGKEDTLIPCSHSEALYRACADPRSELHLFEGAEHAHSILSDRKAYEAIVLAFLRRCGAL